MAKSHKGKGKGRKRFFFEKKKQKMFRPGGGGDIDGWFPLDARGWVSRKIEALAG